MISLAVVFIVTVVSPILGVLGKTIPEGRFSSGINPPTVEIPDGKIIGIYNETIDKNVPYRAFRGIPYAQPPLQELRFASPVKNSKWDGYWDATVDAEACVQGSGDNVKGSEDCLYINVYVPQKAKNLAVMVWIHGGAFTSGDSSYKAFGPDYLLEENIVFVSFNYRLGIFGFLSTEDSSVSGNWGLKDQVLALRWVKKNIEYFGGDPNKITIFGESAGGASVSYLLQIPQALGLFNAAIVQSGTSENLWALSTRARNAAFKVGSNLRIPALLSRTLVKKLRTTNAYKLQKSAASVSSEVYIRNPFRGLTWAPCIEVENSGAVFTKKSDELLKSGQFPSKVPIMIGYNSNEAGHAHGLSEDLRNFLILFDIAVNILAPHSLTSSSKIQSLAASKIKKKFFGSSSIRSQFNAVVEFINTDQFSRPIIRVAENVSPFVPVYFYVFGYIGKITGENPYHGVGHAEDLSYLFRCYNDEYSPEDLVVRAKLVRLWTNFAKYFNPTPMKEELLDNVIWPQVDASSGNFEYVWLNQTISTDANPNWEEYSFYKTLFNEFGEEPFTTY